MGIFIWILTGTIFDVNFFDSWMMKLSLLVTVFKDVALGFDQ